jgi:O-6-methylguanine DNA methyltransferase
MCPFINYPYFCRIKEVKMPKPNSHICVIDSPLGNLKLQASNEALTYCRFTHDKQSQKINSPLLLEVKHQLKKYFRGELAVFNLPITPQGTLFQKSVWQALIKIPYGETRSYRDIAEMIDRPRAMRAVGSANSKNPLCVIVPCHRVILASGKNGGYTGGVDKKVFLLNTEQGNH